MVRGFFDTDVTNNPVFSQTRLFKPGLFDRSIAERFIGNLGRNRVGCFFVKLRLGAPLSLGKC